MKKSTKVKNTKTETESTDYVGAYGADAVVVTSRSRNNIGHRDKIFSYLSAMFSIVAAIASLLSSQVLFSDLPQIPHAYASLIGIVVSTIVGISVIFLLARFIYKKRKAEWEEVIHKVRSKEKELFEVLDLDFKSIIRRRELDAGQTN
jgi:hypothetical protein